MASQDVLSEEGLFCPVCHFILEEPVLLSCKHNFCKNCLKTSWSTNPDKECPFCKRRSSKDEPPVNFKLKDRCETSIQKLISAGSEEVCTLHSEKLQFFCLEHQQPVCVECLHSELHTNHTFIPVDKVTQSHITLVQKLNLLQKVKGDWVQQEKQIKVQAEETERTIAETFKEAQKILEEEKKARIGSLKEERDKHTKIITNNIEDLNKQIKEISDSIKAIGEQLNAPDDSFKQNFKTTVERAKQPLAQELLWPSRALIDVIKHLENTKTYLMETFQQTLKTVEPMVKLIEKLKVKAGVKASVELDPSMDLIVDPSMDPSMYPMVDPSVDPMSLMSTALKDYSCELTLDPNTVNNRLSLSEDNRMVIYGDHKQSYPVHPDRFTTWSQVLCGEDLTGRCYWEVDWRGEVYIGVTYRGIIRREGRNDSCLGRNKKSWVLLCKDKDYTAWHDNIPTPIPVSSVCKRVGVYVDWPAGSLSFYTVSSDTLTHLHTFYCTFTEPLVPGFWVWGSGSSASLCQI